MSHVLNKCCPSPAGEVCKVQALCGPQHTCYQCAMDPWRQPLGDGRRQRHVPHDLGPWARGPPGIQTVWQRGVGHREWGRWRWEIGVLWAFYSLNVSVAQTWVIPVVFQVMTAMWRERTRSPTPSRPYPPTCDPWRVWNPTCSWKSRLWTKGIIIMSFQLRWSFAQKKLWHCQKMLLEISACHSTTNKSPASRWSPTFLLLSTCFFFSCVKFLPFPCPFEITQPFLLFFFPLMAVHLSLSCFVL